MAPRWVARRASVRCGDSVTGLEELIQRNTEEGRLCVWEEDRAMSAAEVHRAMPR